MSLIIYGVFSTIIILIITILLQRRYSYSQTPIIVNICIFLSWYLTFNAVTFLLALDMVPKSHDVMFGVWNFIYWTSFIMTWIIIPLVYSYYQAGEFTIKDRLFASIRANLIFYGIVGVLVVIFSIYIVIKQHLDFLSMLGFLVCLSQVWGLTLLTLLLGYGLVALPKQFWHKGDYDVTIKGLHYKAALDFQELEEAKDEVAQALMTLEHVSNRVKARDPLRKYVDIIEISVPSASILGFDPKNRRISQYLESSSAQDIRSQEYIDEKLLAKLNYFVKNSLRSLFLAQNQWNETLEAAGEIEDNIAKLRNNAMAPGWSTSFWQALLWRYNVYIKNRIYKVLGIICSLFSILLIWGQLIMMFNVNISPLALLINSVYENTAALQFFGLVIASYTAICAFYAMWSLRLFSYYYMRRSHTDDSSLLLNASYLQRLIGPLGYNFYALLRWKGTAFQEVVEVQTIVPFFGSDFNVYFPICIALFALATALNVYGKFLKLLAISYFDPHSDYSGDLITEGRMLIRKSQRMRGFGGGINNIGSTKSEMDQIQLLSTPSSLDSALEL